MEDSMWEGFVELIPQLKGREDVKTLSNSEFIGLVKILNEANKREDAPQLKKYQDVDTALQVVKEAVYNEKEQIEFREALLHFQKKPGYHPAHILLSNDNFNSSPTPKDLLGNVSGIEQLDEVREELIKNVQMNIYEHLNFGKKEDLDFSEINKIIEKQPLAAAALMAISQKNADGHLPKVKIADEAELARKMEHPKVQELASNIPLSSYEHSFTNAMRKATIAPELILSKKIEMSPTITPDKRCRNMS